MKRIPALVVAILLYITVSAQPVISSVSSASGYPGTAITLTGSNFNTTAANNIVYFGATKATVSSASATTLSVTVPTGATFDKISALNTATGLSGYQQYPFLPTYDNSMFVNALAFSSASFYSYNPAHTAIGDIDGDGKPDLVTSSGAGNSITIYRNISSSGSLTSGSFATGVAFTTANGAFYVVLSDIDGDGKLDISVGCNGSNALSVFRNTATSGSISSGSLSARVDLAVPYNPQHMASGDLDGDGKADLAITSYAGSVSVFRNIASIGTITASSFATRADYSLPGNGLGIAMADIDGDGMQDILATSGSGASSYLSIFRNTSTSGSISVATRVDFTTGSTPVGISVGDIDTDGKPDVAVVNQSDNNVSIFRNLATSGTISTSSLDTRVSFTTGTSPRTVIMSDLNGDGKPDIVVNNFSSTSISAFRNTAGSGSFSASTFSAKVDFATAGGNHYTVTAGDLDGDGKPDLVVSNASGNSLSIFRNNPALLVKVTAVSTNTAIPGTAVTITGVNFNTTAANNIVYFGATKGSVVSSAATSLSVTVPAGATYQNVSVLNTGASTVGNSPYPFVPRFDTTNFSLYPTFAPKLTLSVPTYCYDAAFGDIDGDGKADMVVANNNNAGILVYRNISATGSISAGSFSSGVSFATTIYPQTIKLVDMDNDGKLDIVTNCASNDGATARIAVFRNTATSGTITTGSFATRVDVVAGTAITDVAIADFDADGKQDIAIVNYYTATVSVVKNNSVAGTMSFATAVTFASGTSPQSITTDDLDGDGKPDIAVVNAGENTVSVYLNTSVSGIIGAGSFAWRVNFTTGTSPWGVATGDIDGDNKPELIVSNNGSNTISIFRNTATSGALTTGSFAAKVDFSSGSAPRGIAVSDMNGDGKTEIIVVNSGSSTISLWPNIATSGTISTSSLASRIDNATGTSPYRLTVADIDGDNRPDVTAVDFLGGTISILANVKNIAVTSVGPNSAIPGATVTITGYGFNTTAANNAVYFGATKATVATASATTLSVTVPVGSTYDRISVLNTASAQAATQQYSFLPYFNNAPFIQPGLTFNNKIDFSAPGSTYGVAIGDIDGDGKADIVSANYGSNTISIYRNTSASGSITSGSFSTAVNFSAGGAPTGLAIADIDQDGKLDIIVTCQASNNIFLYRNTATSGSITAFSLAAGVSVNVGSTPLNVAGADIDGDGKTDLLVGCAGSSNVYILRNTNLPGSIAAASFSSSTVATPSGPYNIAIGDIDGDGKKDLVTANIGTANISVFRNASSFSSISFNTRVDYTAGTQPYGIAIGDLDADGKPDIVATNYGSGTFSAFRNIATSGSITSGSLAAKVDITAGGGPSSIVIGDFNGDGKPDITVCNRGGSNLYAYYNNISAPGTFSSSTSFINSSIPGTGFEPITAAAGDMDGDGRADLVTANYSGGSISVIRNNPTYIPAITSVAPNTAIPGATVTITGVGFNTTMASNAVYFGATKATVLSGSATTLAVTVPVGSIYSPVSIANTGLGRSGREIYPFLPVFDTTGSFSLAPVFSSRVSIATPSYPLGTALGDIDGDGKPDMVMANNGSAAVLVYRNISNSGSVTPSSFGTAVSFATTNYPQTIKLVDMDNDGKLDIITNCAANDAPNAKIAVFRNTATSGTITTGSFAARVDVTAGLAINDFAVADFDNDGKADIAAANYYAPSISVIKNNSSIGSLSFGTAVTLTCGNAPRGIHAGDLDGDGKADIAVANSTDNNLSVYLNTAIAGTITSSSFAARVNFATGTTPWGLAATDIDGDGKQDLIVSNNGSNTLSIFRNTATSGAITTGSFAGAVNFATGSGPRDIAIGDLNGDTKPDVALVNYSSNTISTYPNTATSGAISTSSLGTKVDLPTGSNPFAIAIGDIDGDTKPEILATDFTGNAINIYRNGILAITGVTPAIAIPGATLTITGKGFNTTAASNIVYMGATKATVVSSSARTLSVTVPVGATFDKISVVNNANPFIAQQQYAFLPRFDNTGYYSTISFDPKLDFATATNPWGVATGDIDGDGKADMVLAVLGASSLSVYRNISSTGTISAGSFSSPVSFAGAGGIGYVRLADMDNDGKLDVVTGNVSTGTITVFRNTATSGSITTGSLATHLEFALSTSPNDLALADFDGDGKIDVATSHSGTIVSILKNSGVPGTIAFASPITLTSGSGGRGIYAGDLDGDSKPDIAVANNAGTTMSVFLNTTSAYTITSSSFATKVDFTTGTSPWGINAADIDGDGKPELITTNAGSNTLSIFRNTATSGTITSGSFAAKVDFNTGSSPREAAVGDFNGDGKPDVAVVNYTSGTFTSFRNTATSGTITTGSMAAFADVATNTNPIAIAAGDLDGDGKAEILVGNYGGSSLSVYRNNQSLQPPLVTAVSTTSAVPGSTITITGSNFNTTAANNIVYFGATMATVTSSSATTLAVTLPIGATASRLSVQNTSTKLTGHQQYPFLPTFDNSGNQSFINFNAGVLITAGSGTYGVATGDIDGDGKADMVVVNNTANTMMLYRNVSSSGTITTGSFGTAASFATAGGSNYVRLADMDGDGKMDVVVANNTANSISVFRNTATSGSLTTSSLAARVDVAIGAAPNDLALADFDMDGKIDIAVTSTNLTILKNRSAPGTLSFTSAATLTTGTIPRGVYAGDLDGDGKPDIAVANNGASYINVFLNLTTPGNISASAFATVVAFTTGTSPWGVTAADIDGDGKPDLVVTNAGSSTISVLRNTATTGALTSGSFAAKVDFTAGTTPRDIAIGDMNGDGKPDVVITNSGAASFSTFRNTATSGTITTASLEAKRDVTVNATPSGVAVGDIDGDGKQEVLATGTGSSTVYIARNNPLPFAPVITTVSPNSAIPGATVSISGTGFNATAANNIVFFGGVKATVSGASATLLTVTLPAGASYSPVTVANTANGLTAYQNDFFVPVFTNSYFKNDTLNFKPVISYTATASASTPYSGAIGDLDGDGKPDMVVNNSGTTSPSVSIMLNTSSTGTISTGSFTLNSNITFAGSGRPNNVKLSDIDGDGKLDIVAAISNVSGASVVVLRNATTLAGSPVFVAANITVGTISAVVAITDFDGDGKPDIAASLPGGFAGVLRNTSAVGSVSFAAPIFITVGTVPSGICFADFDGDGKPDLATVNSGYNGSTYAGSTASVARNTSMPGTLSFASATTVTTGSGPVDIIAGDIDGDGKKDIAVSNYNDNTFSVLRNTSTTGSISFSTKVDFPSGSTPTGINIADLNGDGKLDVAVTNAASSSIAMYRNIATSGSISLSSFAARLNFSTGLYPATVTIGDLDGDGYPEVVAGNSGANSVSVLKNYPLPLIGNTSGPSAVCAGGATITLTNSVPGGYWTSVNPAKATVSMATGVVTGVAAGVDTIVYSTVAGGDTSRVSTIITVNPLADPGTLSGLSVVCEGSSITLTSSMPGGVWSASNALATVTGGVITGVAYGTDTISYTATNGCGSVAATAIITINPLPHTGTLSAASTICGGTSITVTGALPGGVWSVSNTHVSVTGGVVTGLSQGSDSVIYTVTNSCGVDIAYVVVNVLQNQWTGAASSDWNTTGNWSCGYIPGATDDITIPITTTAPVIDAADVASVRSLTLMTGATVTLGAGAQIDVKGNLVYNGSMGEGKVVLSGSILQTISGTSRINEMELNNASGAVIAPGSLVTIGKTLSVTSGTLTTNDSLVLASDISGSARIAELPSTGAAIAGKVQARQYIQGNYRRYRFWAHPFSTALSLGQLQPYMDITGAGGAANGFTPTFTNAPSAFRLDPYTSNSTLGYDPGWKAITKINGTEADSNKVQPHQGLRLFMRGAKGQGLGGFAYTPLENTVSMAGPVNQGDQTVVLHRGHGPIPTQQDYNMVGNPYPSPVDVGTALYNAKQAGNVVGAAFYVYNASLGVAGQFQAVLIGDTAPVPYSIQSNACFQVRAGYDSAEIHFAENMKTPAPTTYLLKPAAKQYVSLNVYDANYHPWDMLTLMFNDAATDAEDIKQDAVKPSGADFNFYSLSGDNKKLVIDSRPFAADKVIPLGISSAYQQDFIIRADNFVIPENTTLYLRDNLLNKNVEVKTGTEYKFTIGKEKNTQGNNRFELRLAPATNAVADTDLKVTMLPNPATDAVKIIVTNPAADQVSIRIVDITGLSVYASELGAQQNGTVTIPLAQLASGIYMVEVTAGENKLVQKLVKE